MNYLFKSLIFVGLLITCNSISTQPFIGPVVECVNCEQYHARTEPRNGLWYNPEQSGVGYSIEVQNGKVFGVYYGYDEAAKPTWLTFVADLVPSDNPEIMWTLDADLLQFEGGNCINCDYQAPNTTSFESTIHIDFKQKNYASFSINEGNMQNIIPLLYGETASADFPEYTSYKFPELEGLWTIVYKLNSELYPWQWAYSSNVFRIGKKAIIKRNNSYWVDYTISWYPYPPESLLFGSIVCEITNQDSETPAPDCIYTDRLFSLAGVIEHPDMLKFHFTLGGLGAYRLFGESVDGHTFEAIKIDSTDYPNN